MNLELFNRTTGVGATVKLSLFLMMNHVPQSCGTCKSNISLFELWVFTASHCSLRFPQNTITRWCMYSLPRRWSSWIPNFSRWLTWLMPTESNGRSLIRRDKTTTAHLCRRAPAVLLRDQKQAAHPAAAATTHHLHTLVSFWRSSVLLFLAHPPLDEACHGSACRGSRAALLQLQLGFLTWARWHQTGFPARFSLLSPQADRTVFGMLVNNYRSADAIRWQTQSTVSTCQPLS